MIKKARKTIILLLLAIMAALTLIPLVPSASAADDGLVVGSTVTLENYTEVYVGNDGDIYSSDIRDAYVYDPATGKTYTVLCLDHDAQYTTGSYTVTNDDVDVETLRAIWSYEHLPDTYTEGGVTHDLVDEKVALQCRIWSGTYDSGWISSNDRDGYWSWRALYRTHMSSYSQISDDELLAYYKDSYCVLSAGDGVGQTQLCFATRIPYEAKGSITIKKVDASGNPLSGAVFTIEDEYGNVVLDNKSTDANGEIFTGIDSLDYGTYTVIETTPPSGYGYPESGRRRTVTVGAANPNVTVTVYNYKYGSIGVRKIDQFGNPVAGAEFDIGDSWTSDGEEEDGDPADPPPASDPAEPVEETGLYIPPKREGAAKRAAAYLVSTRCLPSRMVNDFFHLGLIYESETKQSVPIVAFPYCDLEGNIVGVDSCGVYSNVRYKQMQPGSDPTFAWRFTYGIDRITQDTPLYFCESASDAMSLCALAARPGVYLSMSGCKDITFVGMTEKLGGRPIICTDNDDGGNRFRKKYPGCETLIPEAEYKDWNGELQYRVSAGLDYALMPRGKTQSPPAAVG